MNRLGLDYAWHGPLKPDVWIADGMTFCCRYLSHTASKDIDAPETRLLSDASLDIVVVWETSAARALAGHAAGAADAKDASRKAAALGMPPDRPLYFAVDVDTTTERVTPYFAGVLSVLPVDRVGAYGGYHVIKGLFDTRLIQWGWQTSAWSKVGGKLRWDPRAHLQQYRYDYSGGGLTQADVNRAMFEDFGQWSLREPQEEEMPIDVVHDPDAVSAAREKLEAAGLLTGRDHRSDDAASVGLLMVLVARLLDQVTGPVDLEEYELRLVKKGG